MTGRLNPRRYDLGELRDAVRVPPHERTVGDNIPDIGRDARSPRDDPERTDTDRTVPVEPITETQSPRTETEGPTREFDAEASAEESSPKTSDAASERSDGRGAAPTTGSGSAGASGNRTARTADRHPPATADDVESYLRSRHQRRGVTHASEGVPRDSERRPSRGDAQSGEREPTTEHGRDATRRTPNAAALLAELSGPTVSKPYLDRLPDAYSAQLEVFEWLEWMLAAGGHDGTLTALAYYESIGWLSARSREELADVVAGLSAPQATGRTLDIDDHRESLTHVARLAHRRQR